MGTDESATMDRSYRLSGLQPYFMLAVLVMLTAAAPVVVLGILQGPDAWFGAVWLSILAWFWFNALVRAAYRIDVSGESVEFRAIARTRRTSLRKIRSIRSPQMGYATIRFDGGRFDIVGAIDGWHDFVTRVKTANPAVELKGV